MMSHEEPTIHDTTAASDSALPSTLTDEPLEEQGRWLAESELPRRPRRRPLAPLPLALLLVLLTACGFIGGVLLEKAQVPSSSTPGTTAASRSQALAGGRAAPGAASGTAGSASAGFGGATGAGGLTVGEVAFIHGDTLYVTDTQGNTVKVATSPASTVTKTVKASVKSIHPGETVAVTASTGAGGVLSAESIRVGAGAAGGRVGGLFGGTGSNSSGSRGAGAGSGGSGEPTLFGKGG
jgi:hypothetical protein